MLHTFQKNLIAEIKTVNFNSEKVKFTPSPFPLLNQ